MKKEFETSESMRIGILLAICGGFMDAYSYTCRGGVFANAATGNIVLLAISLGNHNIRNIFHYLIPIVSFAGGVMISQHVKIIRKNRPTRLHWRQVTICFEILAMFVAGFLPQEYNLINVWHSGCDFCKSAWIYYFYYDVYWKPQDRNHEYKYVYGD